MKFTLNKRPVKRILILFLGRYGELIVTFPFLEFLKKLFPNAKITYLIGSALLRENGGSAGKILENNPFVHRWVESDISFVRSMLKDPPYDLVIDLLSRKKAGQIFSYISGAQIKIWGKFRGLPRTLFWATRLKSGRWGKPNKAAVRKRRCRVGMFLEIARFLGAKTDKKIAPRICLSTKEQLFAKNFFKKNIGKKRALVGIHPGTRSWHPVRSWSACSYAEAADALSKESGARVIVFYGPGEKAQAKKISRCAKLPVRLVFEKDIRKLLAMMSACSLFMTSDGGPLHMALALGVRCIGLFKYKAISRYWYDSYHRCGILRPIYIKGGIYKKDEVDLAVKKAAEIMRSEKK